ncbi:glycosyltransferase [Naumannella halotolerans]|uniref:glycosyltransferase n=1 Tax=Naumannella halotolerans TaxID=993414 RepID=UPI00370D0457
MSIKRYGIAFGIIAVTLVVPVLLAAVTALTYLQALVIQLALLAAAGAAGIAVVVVVRASLARTERRLSRAVKQATEAVQKARGDQSRHEYHQELALERIEDLADSARAAAYGALSISGAAGRAGLPDAPRVLFVTSNGSGMGHIARCSAVVRAADGVFESRIVSLSTAALTVRAAGWPVTYHPSQKALDSPAKQWNTRFARFLYGELARWPADVIVFDGTWMYLAVRDVVRVTGIPFVWLRRGLWQESVDLAKYSEFERLTDALVIPGDVAGTGAEPSPESAELVEVDPISLASQTFALPREEALAALGLDPASRHVLVQLAGGNSDGPAEQERAAIDSVLRNGFVPVFVRSPIGYDHEGEGGRFPVINNVFPLVDYAAAWEFTVTKAGYNSVHENLHTITPGIYVPSEATMTDDQVLRAERVAAQGVGLSARTAEEVAAAVDRLSDDLVRARMRAQIENAGPGNGAAQAAGALADIAIRHNAGESGDRSWG